MDWGWIIVAIVVAGIIGGAGIEGSTDDWS